jgi:hypothetical protein
MQEEKSRIEGTRYKCGKRASWKMSQMGNDPCRKRAELKDLVINVEKEPGRK